MPNEPVPLGGYRSNPFVPSPVYARRKFMTKWLYGTSMGKDTGWGPQWWEHIVTVEEATEAHRQYSASLNCDPAELFQINRRIYFLVKRRCKDPLIWDAGRLQRYVATLRN